MASFADGRAQHSGQWPQLLHQLQSPGQPLLTRLGWGQLRAATVTGEATARTSGVSSLLIVG
jgi:hypothetical protein